MSDSAHPGAGGTGTANGDWWELTNVGDSAIDLTGFSWDDTDAIPGTSVFPAVMLEPYESALIVNENDENLPGFKLAWGLGTGIAVIGKDSFTGNEGFSRLKASGDQVNVYDPTDALAATVTFGAADQGKTFGWDQRGTFLGYSVSGIYGAYVAPQNGVGGAGVDIGSPGTSLMLGDVNLDHTVNGLDVDPFVTLVVGPDYQAEADMNGDGEVNGLDVNPFVGAVTGGGATTAAVPEPATWTLVALLAGIGALMGARRRSGPRG